MYLAEDAAWSCTALAAELSTGNFMKWYEMRYEVMYESMYEKIWNSVKWSLGAKAIKWSLKYLWLFLFIWNRLWTGCIKCRL